jgi:hypothetical protein
MRPQSKVLVIAGALLSPTILSLANPGTVTVRDSMGGSATIAITKCS